MTKTIKKNKKLLNINNYKTQVTKYRQNRQIIKNMNIIVFSKSKVK